MLPTTPDMLMRRAARHHLAGRLREAAAIYRKLLQDDPRHTRALHALGVMAHQTGREEAAEKLLLRAVAIDPSLAVAHDDLGALWLLQGKVEQAAAAFGEAARIDPRHALARAHLGAALLLLNRPEESAIAYQQAVDTAVSSFRRLRAVGIDVRPVTDALAPAAPTEATFPALAIVAGMDAASDPPWPEPRCFADPLAAEPSPYLPGADVAVYVNDPRYVVVGYGDDEDDDGVVGLTLVPPSAIASLLQATPVGPPPTIAPEDVGPLAARAETVELAYPTPGWIGGLDWGEPDITLTAGAAVDYAAATESAATESAATEAAASLALAMEAAAAVAAEEPVMSAATASVTATPVPATPVPATPVPATPVPATPMPAPAPVAIAKAVSWAIDDAPALPGWEVEQPVFPTMVGGREMPVFWSSGSSAVEPATAPHALPFVEAVVGDPRYDAPHAMMMGARLAADAVAPPARGDAATTAEDCADSNGHVTSSSAVGLEPVGAAEPGTADEPYNLVSMTALPGVAGEGEPQQRTLAEPPGPDAAEAFSNLSQLEVARSADEDEGDPLEAAVDEADAPARPISPVTRVVFPPSASRLADDPMMAPRQLAKELRRARFQPVPDARQAATLHKQGTRHLRQRRVDEAIAALQRLVELHPSSAKAHRDLGAAYTRADRLEDAMASLTRALELRPRFADAFASLGDVYHLQGRVEEAINCYRQTLALRPTASSAHSNLLLTLNYQRKTEAHALFAEHVKWGRVHAAALAGEILPHHNDPTPGRQIRIGYVSGDFRRHAVGSFIEPVLANRDPDSFHVICYSDVLRHDDATERLSAMADGWRDIRGLSDADVAEMIRHDRIDILVDLAGHTGKNRLCVFARKPAPIQVTYLGYPNTTGLPTMDYRLTDAWADPLCQVEQFHTEQLYRLPRGFLCYQPPADAPDPTVPPIAGNGYLTFGCFNILAKLTPETLGLWAKIMTVLPKSRIVLKDRHGAFASSARRRHVQDIFTYHRISADRLDLLDKEPDRVKHLESYGKVDIMLDPFPYNGTTTTCEALWMGVPVISLAGTRHASRVGVSILKSAGLPEFIAPNIEGYARTAVLMGRDIPRLTLLRKTLRQKLSHGALTDGPKYTQALGQAYRDMWQYWCQARGPFFLAAES